MDDFRGLIPVVACAIIVGVRWRRSTDADVKVYNIKKRHWYAILESALLITAAMMILRGL